MLRRDFLGLAMAGLDPREPVREFSRGGMRYRRLGRTDIFVSALGFGAHTDYQQRVRGPDGARLSDDFQKIRIRQTERAIDLGINVVDVYDEARQWEPLSRLIQGKRDKVLVATKFNEFPGHVGRHIERAARMFGWTDLGRYVIREETAVTPEAIENWDLLRKAKAAGQIRAIGIATHSPEVMKRSLDELEGLEFIFFPYNFIHAKAGYEDFIRRAVERGVGLVAMKPLASGSIVKLDPRRPRPNARSEGKTPSLSLQRAQPLLQQAVAKLLAELDRSPEETLAQAALRFVLAQPFIGCALTGMFLPEELEENYQAFVGHAMAASRGSAGGLEAASRVAALSRGEWLPEHYRWLDERWSLRS